MGSRLLIATLALSGCLVNGDLYDERQAALAGGTASPAIDGDGDGFFSEEDCDDANEDVSPDADEVPYNGLDDDCDPGTLDDDADGDGFGGNSDDCDDGNASINPNANEIYYNGIDEDCDAGTDDDDQDADGVPVLLDCDDLDADRSPTNTEIAYNQVDDDCNVYTRDDDLDGDGALLAADCDDTDPDVGPAEDETVYNGVDDDCNAFTPDDDLDEDGFALLDDCNDDDINHAAFVDYFLDVDGDAYGGAVLVTGCADEVHPGTILVGGDCDDGNRRIHPDTTWYEDTDLDGAGDPAVSLVTCDPGAGWAFGDADCDPADGSVFPGALDTCGDGVSNSCGADVPCRNGPFGTIDARDLTSVWTFAGIGPDANTGVAVAGGADVDGDGWPDVAIGADGDGDAGGVLEFGAVFVAAGQLLEGAADAATATYTLLGEEAGDGFGAAVALPGDVDGDGYGDILVGAPNAAAGKGAAYLILGPPTGTMYMANAAGVAQVDNLTLEVGLGTALAGAGDTNGDGYADWVVSSGGIGKSWLVLGKPSGWANTNIGSAKQLILDDPLEVGASLAHTDHDGDGLDDVILGAPGRSAAWVLGGAELSAAVAGSTLSVGTAGMTLDGLSVLDRTGAAVAGGDLNDDGFGDVVIGAPLADSGPLADHGEVFVFYGSNGAISGTFSLASAATKLLSTTGFDQLGASLAVLDDATGDGFNDLAIGAASDGDGGWVAIVPGDLPTGAIPVDVATEQLLRIDGDAFSGFGDTLAAAGDTDRDGLGDLLLGEGAGSGSATLLFGAWQ